MTRFILPAAVSNNIYYRQAGGFTYLSPAGKSFKKWVAWQYRGEKPVDGNVWLDIHVLPKLNKNGQASKVVQDLDNVLKCILDSLQGVYYHNDKQVKKLSLCYGEPVPGGGIIVDGEILI